MTSELLATAQRYAELGFRVFPCTVGEKRPITKNGLKDGTTDPDQIQRWWTDYPNANIGLVTAGLVVIDIDGPDNPWLSDDPEKLASLAQAPTSQTPRGGRHHLFRQPDGKSYRNSASKLAPNVDVRADGGYIVVAPSVVDGKAYQWLSEGGLDRPLDQLPGLPEWLACRLDQPACVAPTIDFDASFAADGGPIPEGQRNATLASLGGTMRRVGMSEQEILAALLTVNQSRCCPPLDTAEVESIARSIARYSAGGVISNQVTGTNADVVVGEENDEPDLDDPGPIPDRLLQVPGFIDQVMRYTLDTAPYPEPVLAFAGALCLQAALAGRKVRDQMDNRTNLYVLGLANSGVGKDHARKVNARILNEVGMIDSLGTSFASGEGLEDRLFAQPTSLFQVDEIDGLLLRVGQARDARHESIVSILLQMYSASNSVHPMRAKAGLERTSIDQPCLCLFGTAVPKHFYESLSARMTTNGLLARMLILECRGRGVGRDAIDRPIPDDVVKIARQWAEYRPGRGNLSSLHPEPMPVEQDTDATAMFQQLRTTCDAAYAEREECNDTAGMAIWARAYEKARRLALIYAVSANHVRPMITADSVTWASEFVMHQTKRMLYMANHYATENDFDCKRKRLLEVLTQWHRKEGDKWMPSWRITRKLPWMTRDHDELRATLHEQRLIEFRTTQTKGRPGLVYRLLKSAVVEGHQ